MTPGIIRIIISSARFYRKQVLYQFLIILLLATVITGSLMTGNSVRESLRRTSSERLGNTGIVVSSGLRYYDPSLSVRFKSVYGTDCTGLLELNGSIMNISNQKELPGVHIFAVNKDFFRFNGSDTALIQKGDVLINRKLATALSIKEGDDVVLHFGAISDIPADAPFAPGNEQEESVSLKVSSILSATPANFSLSISQVAPLNVFISFDALKEYLQKDLKYNRLLIDRNASEKPGDLEALLQKILTPEDIGLKSRALNSVKGNEIISDRIFFDNEIIDQITKAVSSSKPVLTYLANRIESGSSSTPYSFVSALSSELTGISLKDSEIIFNKWLAEDLNAKAGDSVRMFWYAPDSLNHLVERSKTFTIHEVVGMQGIWGDSLLMPEFPGIAGSESCSDWDAGVPIRMDAIRDKDEAYWREYKGTPKAFISYTSGEKLWGNNYGRATSIRYNSARQDDDIIKSLTGRLDPLRSGFNITDLAKESMKAADESVDFSTLFLSLGFFLILASFVLLSFAVSFYLELKSRDFTTMFMLGFRNSLIQKVFFAETAAIALVSSLTGSFAGYFINIIIIKALNSVWQGAVQTNTLVPVFDVVPVLTGFFSTLLFTLIFMYFKVRKFLRKQGLGKEAIHKIPSAPGKFPLLISLFLTAALLGSAFLIPEEESILSFAGGMSMLLTFLLLWRYIFTRKKSAKFSLANRYFAFNPSAAVAPVLFIATGLFAFILTSVNRKDFSDIGSEKSSGTGGYLFWCETTFPVKPDLKTINGRKELGFDEDSLADLNFVQFKRYSSNDASCLNLNHISAPSILAADAQEFFNEGSFSFARTIGRENPWNMLSLTPGPNTVYGIADQTVLEWGLKISVGDTIKMKSETGSPLNIIIAGGLESSVFQGYVLIGKESFSKFFPSASGSSVMLVRGNPSKAPIYTELLSNRFSNNGIYIEKTTDRLAGFYEITNTYLSVFGVFGGFGIITGVAGLGFVLLRNYNRRKREFALLMATGFPVRKIRKMISSEQIKLIMAGVITGIIPALVATLPSLRSNHSVPWTFVGIIILLIIATGYSAIMISISAIKENELTGSLRKE